MIPLDTFLYVIIPLLRILFIFYILLIGHIFGNFEIGRHWVKNGRHLAKNVRNPVKNSRYLVEIGRFLRKMAILKSAIVARIFAEKKFINFEKFFKI